MAARAHAKAVEEWNIRQYITAYNKWCDYAEETADQNALLTQGKECYSMRSKVMALSTQWRRNAAYLKYLSRLTLRATRWWVNQHIAEAFVCWQQHAVDALDAWEADRAAVVHRIQTYLLDGLQIWRLKASLMRDEKIISWRSSMAGAEQWDRHMCQYAIDHMRAQARVERANKKLTRKAGYHADSELMQRFLDRWLDLGLAWRIVQDDRKNAILHWAEMELTAAANNWRMVAWDASDGAQAMVTGVSRWHGSSTFMALSVWRDWARWLRNEEQAEGFRVTAAIDSARLSKMTEVMSRLRNLDNDGRMSDAEQIWRSRALDSIFCRWREYTSFYYELRELLARGSFRFYHRCLSESFVRWRSHERGVRMGSRYSQPMTADPLDLDFEAQYQVELRG
jgi:hypothetical protein